MKIRKVLSAFLAVICMITSCGFCTLGVYAEDTNTVYATTSESVVQSNRAFCYVYIDDMTDLSALTVSVYYDTSKVTVTKTYNSVSCTAYDSSNKDGCVQFSYVFDGKGSNTKTNLFYFSYKVNSTAEAGDTYFDIVVSDACDANLETVNIKGSRCHFAVKENQTQKTCKVSSSSSISSSVKEEFTLSYSFNTYQIASGMFEIIYDKDLFELVEFNKGTFLDGKIADVNSTVDGYISVSFAGTKYNYNTHIMTVKFRTLKNVNERSDITFSVKELHDIDLNPITCNEYTTSVTVALDEAYVEDAPGMILDADYDRNTGKATVAVKLEKDSYLGAGDFVLNFDTEYLTYASAENGFTPTYLTVNDKHAAEGVLKFSVISTTDITDEITVLTFTFDAVRGEEERIADFELTGGGLTDALGETVVLNFIDTSLKISDEEVYTVSGSVTSFISDKETVTVSLIRVGETEAAFTSSVKGNIAAYSFEDVPVGEYTLRVSKANHLDFEENVSVIAEDVVKDVTLVLGNNGKEFKINSASLILVDNINVIYYATVPEGFTDPRMVFLFNGKETTVTEYTEIDERGRYRYDFTNVFPQKIGDNICATLYATVDGTEVSVSVPVYSVRQYCENLLNKNPDGTLKRLISDLLVYGEKTQLYQGYKTDVLVTEGLELSPSEFTPMGAEYNKQKLTGESDADVRYSGARLELKSDMTLVLGITSADPSPYTFEVTLKGDTKVFTAEDLYEENGKYYLSFKGIYATQYDDVITAVIKKDGEQVSQTLEYSVYTYIQKNQDTENEKLRDLIRAIYNYGESAKLYNNQ